MPEPTPVSLSLPCPTGAGVAGRIVGVTAALALVGASLILVILTAIFWGPLLLAVGMAMIAVWTARRRRQAMQGRNSNEVKDPRHIHRPWPTQGIIDDRLPDP